MTIQELSKQTNQIEGFYIALKKQEQELLEAVESLKKNIDIDTKASAALKHLLDMMVKKEITRMAGLITYGLRTIFDDQDLTFLPEITVKNGRTSINFTTLDGTVKTDFKSSGGSISVIESFLIRTLCMLKMNLARLMFLDETFSAIDDLYISNTGEFIKELSKKIGIDILLVTHKVEFKNHADNAYRMIKTKKGLIMEKIK